MLYGDELLDAVALGEYAEQSVRDGNPYIGIDLTGLDYIYSDSINRFVKLNRIILDINGRIVLVASHPKVLELMEKAGVQNFIKVCTSYDEVQRISDIVSNSGEKFIKPVAPTSPAKPAEKPVEKPADKPLPVTGYPTQKVAIQPAEKDSFEEVKDDSQPKSKGAESSLSAFADSYDFEDGESKKISPLVLIFTLLIVALLVGGGAYFFLSSQHTAPVEQPVLEAEEPAVVEEEKKEFEKEKTPEPAAQRPAAERPATQRAAAPAQTQRRSEIPIRRAPAQQQTRAPQQAQAQRAPAKGPIRITSNPSGATVRANGEVLGTTPYTWENPSAYGDIVFTFRMGGYEELSLRQSYFNETISVRGDLVKIEQQQAVASTPATRTAAQPQAAASTPATRTAAQPQAAASTPATRTAAQPQAAASTPATRTAEQPQAAASAPATRTAAQPQAAASTPASRPAAQPQAAAPASRPAEQSPAATTPAPAQEAATGTVFVTSLPPMADIYVNGRVVGKANTGPITLPVGSHTLELVHGARKGTQQVTLRSGNNPSVMVRLQ